MSTTTVSLDTFRSHLLKAAHAGDGYQFITLVDDYLGIAPEDDQIRAMAIGELVKKGLIHPAIELARACPPTTPKAAELAAVADQLDGVSPGPLSWDNFAERFESNRTALGERNPALAEEIASVWRNTRNDLSAYLAQDGNYLARIVRPNGQKTWVPAAIDFKNVHEVAQDVDAWKNRVIPPFMIEGVGMGWLISRVHEHSQRTFLTYSPAIYIIEENVRALAMVLQFQDWGALLRDERVYLFGGDQAWEQWRQALCDDPTLPLPPNIITPLKWPGAAESKASATVAAMADHRAELLDRETKRSQALLSGRNAAYWANRFATADSSRPLRVLGVTSRFTTFLQHSTRDLFAAMERAGIQTRLAIEARDDALLPPHHFHQLIADFSPDMIFVIDHHRHEYAHRFPSNIPFVCWIQDDLTTLFSPDVGPQLGALDFTIGYGMTSCVLKHGYPEDRFMPCKLAIEPTKFQCDAEAKVDPALLCDVAYVSHHGESPEALHQRFRQQDLAGEAVRFLDVFFEETRSLFRSEQFNGAYDLARLVEDVERKTGLQIATLAGREEMLGRFVRPLADRTLRHATLEWVADWADAAGRSLALYGRGWEEHPRFGRYARGEASHGEHLAAISRAAGINLHMGMNNALHQRVLETLCAGGFLLVRYHPFDFYEPSFDSFHRFIEQRGITKPTEIPLSEFPDDYIATRHERAALRGETVPESVQITAEVLLEMKARAFDPPRYHYANLAFPGFDRITFNSREQFAQRADHFLSHADERQSLITDMQASVNELFTYDALVPRIVDFLKSSLQQQ